MVGGEGGAIKPVAGDEGFGELGVLGVGVWGFGL